MKYTTVNAHVSTICDVMAGVQPLAGPALAVRLTGRSQPGWDDRLRFRAGALGGTGSGTLTSAC